MKKIAILTQPLGNNYGGIIQNYALQKVLVDNGLQPVTINRIDFNPNSRLKIGLSIFKLWLLKKILNQKLFTTTDQKKIYYNNQQFIYKNINLSAKIDNTKSLLDHFRKKKYDAVIVGSDQTWRPSYSPNIYNYFLDFLEVDKEITKVAYATSFGTDQWEFTKEETQRCKELAKTFDKISVREKSGIDLCKKHLDFIPEFVLDPTMLLKKEDYLQLIASKNLPKRSGVFSYILDETDETYNVIEEVSELLKLEHFTNQPKNRTIEKKSTQLEDHVYPPLEGWLQAFSEADFIVTNSFHGTVFSIIFNKPFVSIAHSERGASRFHSLLSLFGLEDRLLTDKNKLNEIVMKPIDYAVVNQKLEELRKHSISFLRTSLLK